GQEQITIRIDVAEVADRVAASSIFLRVGSDIAELPGSGRREEDFADFPDIRFGSVFAKDLQRSRSSLADRSRLCKPLTPGDSRTAAALRAAIGLENPVRAEPVDPGTLHPLRARCGK